MIKSLCNWVWSWSKIQLFNEFLMQLFDCIRNQSLGIFPPSSFLTHGILTTTWSSITKKGTRCSVYLSSPFTLSACYIIYVLFLYLYLFACILACYCGQKQIAQIWQGYDVAAIACPERYVVGLDISDIAIKKAVEVRAVGQKILTSLRPAIS